jgi:hypothetical protein
MTRAVWFLAVVPLACGATVIAHGGKAPRWPLRGAHGSLACETCHGDWNRGCGGKPDPQTTSCIGCHQDDVDDDHHPGRECSVCHVEDGWLVGVTEPPSPPTGDTGLIAPVDTALFDHGTLAPDRLCWDCHELGAENEARPEGHFQDPNGFDRTFWWDCGPCHTTTSWADDALFVPLHPVRTPHGTHEKLENRNPTDEWVVACADCHPVPGDYRQFVCDDCHAELWERGHKYLTEASPDTLCYGGCHPIGDQP